MSYLDAAQPGSVVIRNRLGEDEHLLHRKTTRFPKYVFDPDDPKQVMGRL
jgi:hypothetical protein